MGVQQRLRGMGAECVVGGADWYEADQGARERVRATEGGYVISCDVASPTHTNLVLQVLLFPRM